MPTPDPIPPLKIEMANHVVQRLHGWSQGYAASFIWIDQPRMSDLRNGRLTRFSLEQLVRFAARLGAEVTINVTWTKHKRFIAAGSGAAR